jgi:hypothetical protein
MLRDTLEGCMLRDGWAVGVEFAAGAVVSGSRSVATGGGAGFAVDFWSDASPSLAAEGSASWRAASSFAARCPTHASD